MALIFAYRNRGLSRDITIQDADEATIRVTANDLIRATIGRDGETPQLTVTSGTPTVAGSSFTKNVPSSGVNRLRLDASDLAFEAGTYTLQIDFFDFADASEWKTVSKQVFHLESSTEESEGS